jgi:hypothetical protein
MDNAYVCTRFELENYRNSLTAWTVAERDRLLIVSGLGVKRQGITVARHIEHTITWSDVTTYHVDDVGEKRCTLGIRAPALAMGFDMYLVMLENASGENIANGLRHCC